MCPVVGAQFMGWSGLILFSLAQNHWRAIYSRG